MATDILVPELGESISEVVLVEWLKADGETVERDEPICLLETDKANVDLPAPVAGVLRQLQTPEAELAVGALVGRIEEAGAGEAVAGVARIEVVHPDGASAPEADAEAGDLSPAVRRLIEEHGLDAAALPGTGRGGRLTKEDVLAHLAAQAIPSDSVPAAPVEPAPVESAAADSAESAPAESTAAASPAKPSQPSPAAGSPTKAPQSDPPAALPAANTAVERQPMSRMRQRIAQRLVSVQHETAMLTTFNEIDLQAVVETRKRYKERFTQVHGVSLGYMSFFSRAVALALGEFPPINARIEGNDIVYHPYVHLGIAVSTERGLVVPVLKHAETMSMAQIESEIKRMAGEARDNRLGLDELSGGTFTITNGGVFGSMLSTPILNAPQSGILGMHAIEERPVAVGGEVVIRPMMYVALSYDHRLIDGQQSVSFLVRVKELLEDPVRLLLEI